MADTVAEIPLPDYGSGSGVELYKRRGKKQKMIKTDECSTNERKCTPCEGKIVSIMRKFEAPDPGGSDNNDEKCKSVGFSNDVDVVYFDDGNLVVEMKESLKKETEQQLRNKEMRRLHSD